MIKRILLALFVVTFTSFTCAQEEWQNVSRIVAIGDLHGDYEQFVKVMTMAGLIDDEGEWAGGKTHLVQTGDIPDRAADSLKIINHLQRLEKQARRAGGYVHLLIGNHEAMNVYRDLRYVHPGESQNMVDSRSERRREQYYRRHVDYLSSQNPEMEFDETFRQQWEKLHPPGFVEHRLLWQPDGKIGKWVRRHNTVIRINDILFVHGGISPHTPFLSLDEINTKVRRELGKLPLPPDALASDPQGPLWYRGLIHNPEETERPAVMEMLRHYGANHIVMGHTTGKGAIRPRFDGHVIAIDVGLSRAYGGHMACLVIDDGKFYALHRGHRLPIPRKDADVPAYLRAIHEIDPGYPAEQVIDELQAPATSPEVTDEDPA
ncbi:MAG: metallophosphoesterase [Pseudomonadales bacterium]|nr:metallophosphoesterase [Pseudomonadales bacterium]